MSDPRYSRAFQRGYGDEPRSYVDPLEAVRSRRPSTAVERPPVSEPPAADAPLVSVEPAEEVDSARTGQVFHVWTVVLFLVGAGLSAAAFGLFSQLYGAQFTYGFNTSPDGELTVTSYNGGPEISVNDFLRNQFLMQMAPWVAVVGLATIVGNLFRLAHRHGSPRR